jgi:hypothetical protein
VFQKVAAGHPKFGAEREVRSSTWESSALIASHLDAPRVPKKPFLQKNNQKVGAGWRQGFRWYERAGERPERTQAVGLKEWWKGLQLAERASEFSAADERAWPMSSIRLISWSMAVPNLSSDPSEV